MRHVLCCDCHMIIDCCIAYLVHDPVKGLLVHALKLLNLIKYNVI